MQKIESDQIEIARVICILLMMTVHVPPGLSVGSWVTGEGWLWGEVMARWLGVASVAALSFFSGFLLHGTLKRLTLSRLALNRARGLLLPMLVWNLAFIALKGLQQPDWLALELETEGTARFVLAGVLGLTGETVNLSLFFLRDLFACSIVVALLVPLMKRAPGLVMAAVLLVDLFDAAEPLIFRPSLLVFMVAGYICRDRSVPVARLSDSRFALPLCAALIASALVLSGWHGSAHAGDELVNLLKRVAMVLLAFWASRQLAASPVGSSLAAIAPASFPAYLSHMIVFGGLWVAARPLVGSASAPAYLAFFLLAPPVAYAAGVLLNRGLDAVPPAVQVVARGRTRR